MRTKKPYISNGAHVILVRAVAIVCPKLYTTSSLPYLILNTKMSFQQYSNMNYKPTPTWFQPRNMNHWRQNNIYTRTSNYRMKHSYQPYYNKSTNHSNSYAQRTPLRDLTYKLANIHNGQLPTAPKYV